MHSKADDSFLKRTLHHWRNLFGLQNWHIGFRWFEWENDATVDIDYGQRQARMTVDSALDKKEADPTSCHENLHILHYPLQEFGDVILRGEDRKETGDKGVGQILLENLGDYHRRLLERSIERLTKPLVALERENRELRKLLGQIQKAKRKRGGK